MFKKDVLFLLLCVMIFQNVGGQFCFKFVITDKTAMRGLQKEIVTRFLPFRAYLCFGSWLSIL